MEDLSSGLGDRCRYTASGANTDKAVGARDMLVRVRDMLAALHSILTTSTIAAWWTTPDSRFTTKRAGLRQGSTIQ